MSVANNYSVSEFLDLNLHINEHNKICVDVYAKPTNSFTYLLPSACYPKNSINKIPKGIADEKFDIRNSEYQNYLIARDYNSAVVRNLFHSFRNMSGKDARRVNPKSQRLNVTLLTLYILL